MASAADRLADLLRTTVGVELPVRLRAWDGSEAGPLDEPDGPVLVIHSRRAMRRLLWCPGELGLARAYVTGDIDVEGDLADGLRRVWRLAREQRVTGISPRGAMVAALRGVRLGAVGPPPRTPAGRSTSATKWPTQRCESRRGRACSFTAF